MSFRLQTALAIAASALLVPTTVRAQLYSWKDASGHIVLSQQPPADQTTAFKTYAVGRSETYRTVRQGSGTTKYDAIIEEHATRNQVSPELVRAVVQAESAFNPRARSPKGALGLMQLMPSVIADYGVLNAFDPADNIRAGVAYLRDLLVKYEGKVELALAAYNAGPVAVAKYGGKVPPYRETQQYVAKIQKVSGQSAKPPQRLYRKLKQVNGHLVSAGIVNVKPPAGTLFEEITIR